MEMIVAPLGAERETQELRQMIAHLGRVSTLGELSASLAHELNQPLSAILSNVQAARRFLAVGPPDLGELHEILTDIEEDDRRAGEIIRRLRSLVRNDPTDRQLLFLQDQAREVADLVSPEVRIRQIPIVLEMDPALPPVRADRIQLSQVILNLMMNGADAMVKRKRGERELVIRTWRYDHQSAALSVRDHGSGIQANPIDRIFDPFYTSKSDGLGMGLSICRSIVEAHGGRIWATNNPERGATIQFVLPLVRKEA
jgi:two-component system sensor kinase FixL